MGYYSEVGIAIKEKSYQDITEKACGVTDTKLKDDIMSLITSATDNYVVNHNFGYLEQEDPYRILHWKWVKWYIPEFHEVVWFMEKLKECDDYQFIRLGEDIDDTEQDSKGDIDMLYINRSIDLP